DGELSKPLVHVSDAGEPIGGTRRSRFPDAYGYPAECIHGFERIFVGDIVADVDRLARQERALLHERAHRCALRRGTWADFVHALTSLKDVLRTEPLDDAFRERVHRIRELRGETEVHCERVAFVLEENALMLAGVRRELFANRVKTAQVERLTNQASIRSTSLCSVDARSAEPQRCEQAVEIRNRSPADERERALEPR